MQQQQQRQHFDPKESSDNYYIQHMSAVEETAGGGISVPLFFFVLPSLNLFLDVVARARSSISRYFVPPESRAKCAEVVVGFRTHARDVISLSTTAESFPRLVSPVVPLPQRRRKGAGKAEVEDRVSTTCGCEERVSEFL